jgi:Ni/Co efflux regulator RcnB
MNMNRLVFLALSLSLSFAAVAQHSTKETQEDIARHRAMAAAHEAAAKCLESGKKHDQCQKELQTACKGLALGKSCGMKHSH